MPYIVCKTLEIENGHLLSKHPDACQFPHGHSRKIEISFQADNLDANDMVCDFKLVEYAVAHCIRRFDHAFCINTDDPQYEYLAATWGERVIPFEHKDPTCEVMARTIFDSIHHVLAEYCDRTDARYPLAPGVQLVCVRVWETSGCWAEYRSVAD